VIALKTCLFALLGPGTATILLPYLLLLAEAYCKDQPIAVSYPIGGVVIAVGGLIALSCVWDFAVHGKGTPAPIDPPKHLVVRGLYRYSRNAMYIGMLTIMLGEAVVFASLVLVGYTVVAFLTFHTFVVYYEEPTLRNMFGSEFEAYCDTVPRWIPRFPK
jgi:protein-S-isoprenylcysteine O-methyltransferase Ste14